MIKSFRRASAAYEAVGEGPLLAIENGRDKIYVVGIERLTQLGIIAQRPSGARQYTGFIGCGHLDRLGNANGAIRTDRRGLSDMNAFDQAGLMQREADPIRAALDKAISFITSLAGFEGDELQEGIHELLAELEAAKAVLK